LPLTFTAPAGAGAASVAVSVGVAALRPAHTDLEITTATIDPELDRKRNKPPGLGDAGERIIGTHR
jgi:uracil phosphoribosyltransferase